MASLAPNVVSHLEVNPQCSPPGEVPHIPFLLMNSAAALALGRTCCYVTVCLGLTSDHMDRWTENAVSTLTSGPMTGYGDLVQQHP